ncbi:MAG: hypothetical protein DMG05_20170, partial [Acidobacteria bacterium]
TDVGKGFTYATETDSVGRYILRSLPPSTYKLTVEIQGFNTHVQDGIVLNVNQNATIDVSLKLGAETQTVEVVAAAAILSTQDSVTGQELNRTFINDLPLLGRSVFDLAKLSPGITQVSGGYIGGGVANNFISNGGRNATADILMDGVSTTNFEQNSGIQTPLYTPSVDAVQEFKVQQSNFSAEVGFSGATVINLVTRSGTNAFHGSAYEFLRNNVLTANDWFSNASGGKLAARRYNLFGGTVGGPIKKDKTFFFFDYEGLRDTAARTFRAGVPSAAMRNGDFGEICGAGFDTSGMCSDPEGQLWDPYSGVYDSNEGGPVRSRFIPFNNMANYVSPGNPKLDGTGYQLPTRPGNLIDPVAFKMAQFYPLPNLGVGTAAYDRFNNWIGTGSDNNSNNQWDIKVDHSFSERDRLSGKFSRSKGLYHAANAFGNVLDSATNGQSPGVSHIFALNYTHTFSPKTLLNLSLGFARNFGDSKGILPDFPDFDPIKDLGVPEYMGRSGIPSTPAIYISNYAAAGPLHSIGSQAWGILRQGPETHHLLGSLSRVQGRHDLKFGAEGRMHRISFVQPGAPAGVLDYEFNSTSQLPWSGGGDSMASFLTGVGVPGGWGEYEVPAFVSTQSFQYAWFVQDNWRVNDKLTLNLGLRYDLTTPRTERYNRMSYLDPDVASPLQVPGLPNLRGGLRFADANNRNNFGADHNDFGPRFGVAYRLTDRTVLRGGYGVFYTVARRGASGTGAGGFQGFDAVTNWFTSYQSDGATPWGRLSDPWPITGPKIPPGSSQGLLSYVGAGVAGPLRSVSATPYEQTWSFGIQRELPGSVVIDANYVGKKGTKLYFGGAGELNHLGPGALGLTRDQISALNEYVPNPFYGIITEPGDLSAPEIQAYRLQLTFPQFTSFSADEPPVANSIYHAFQLRVEKRFSKGLQFLVTYTNAKSIDDASVTSGGTTWLGGRTSLQDPNNRRLERSLSQYDIPQVLGFNYTYELPVGRGKAIGGNWNPWLDAVIGGWRTNGIWRFSKGQPIALTLNGGQSLPTFGDQRPSLTGTLERNTGSNFLDQYFGNPDVAVVPEPYVLGTAPRTLPNLRSPGINVANLSLFKEIPLTRFREGMRLEYRAEFFNAFNHPHFCGPNDQVNGGSFGKITSMCTSPREIQMALKFYW